jgi:hypothetical protein
MHLVGFYYTNTGFECHYSPALGIEDLPVRGYRSVLDVQKTITVDIHSFI